MLPDLFRRLKPFYPKLVDAAWIEHQISDPLRRAEIEALLTLLAIKRFGLTVGGDEPLLLDPPPADLIGNGDYQLGNTEYPSLPPRPVRVSRSDLLRHVFLLGPTGTGKSTLLLGLLAQLLADRMPLMVFDFKRNYRSLLPHHADVLVLTIGSTTAPLRLNVLTPPQGVTSEEWTDALSDITSTAYLLLQGARNVLKEALQNAYRTKGTDATLRHAYHHLASDLAQSRAGSRRYGWLESSTRALDELTKGAFGNSLTTPGMSLPTLLRIPIVFELQSLGDDQKRWFCLFVLQAILLTRKTQTLAREVLYHVLVFDESHHVFPRERPGELGIPSRLAREVREFGEALLAATQQADVSESLIANSGIKIILRTDYPKDVAFASSLMQLDHKWFPRLPIGHGIIRLPTRYYLPFLLTFPPQPGKNTLVTNHDVNKRYETHPLVTKAIGTRPEEGSTTPGTGSARDGDALGESNAPPTHADESPGGSSDSPLPEKEDALLRDVAAHPITTITGRYTRLGWHPKTGNTIKDRVIRKGLCRFDPVTTPRGIIKILSLTTTGRAYLTSKGVPVPTGRRGGATHEYWRHELTTTLERHGWTVTHEKPIGGGKTIDLHATKADQHRWIEIETGASDITANIDKLNGLPGSKVLFCTTSTLAMKVSASVTAADVLLLQPEHLANDLDRLTG